MIDHHPDRTPHPRKALAGRGRMRRRLCGHCRPVAVRAPPSPLYGLGEVSRGGGSRELPGERLSHTWCRRRVILRHHVCERTSLVALTLLLPYRGAQLVRAAVGHGGALRGAAPPLVLQEAQQSLSPIPEKEPSLIAGRLQIPRGRRLSPSTRADSSNSRLLLPSPSPTLPPQAAATKPSKTKDRSISAVKHRGEMMNNRRGLD